MKEHMKPTIIDKEDCFKLELGTNDLNREWEPALISEYVVDLAFILKRISIDVSMSNIIVGNKN